MPTFMPYEGEKGILIYMLSGKEFGCDLNSVVNIIKAEEYFNNSNKFQIDLTSINYNSDEFKLIDLYQLLGLHPSKTDEAKRLLFMEIENQKICFFTERLVELLTDIDLSDDFITHTIQQNPSEYFKNYLEINDRKICWPDYEALCRDIKRLPAGNISNFIKKFKDQNR